MAREQSLAILFEILRSFTSLARTLNTPKSVAELGVTRQTLRRHLNLLEEAKGEKMFNLVDRRYQLTEAGRNALPEAEDLLARGKAWLDGQSGRIDNLFHINYRSENNDFSYFLQQHPITDLWEPGNKLLRFGFQCWAKSCGEIESSEFEPVRPYAMIFRPMQQSWLCSEVGSKSSYASWYGWAWERSSVGRLINELPGGSVFARLSSQPFDEVGNTRGIRLDHIHTQIVRSEPDTFVPISYKRLLLGCRFPDHSPAIVSILDRRNDISIHGLDFNEVEPMPSELTMKPEIPAEV